MDDRECTYKAGTSKVWYPRQAVSLPIVRRNMFITNVENYRTGHSKTRWGRERDSQRKKLYAAERNIHKGDFIGNIDDIRRYVTHLCNVLSDRYTIKKIVVKDGRGYKCASGYAIDNHTGKITMPSSLRYELWILHEVSHAVTDALDRVASWHGPLFCSVYLDLVQMKLGTWVAVSLRDSYDRHGVVWGPK